MPLSAETSSGPDRWRWQGPLPVVQGLDWCARDIRDHEGSKWEAFSFSSTRRRPKPAPLHFHLSLPHSLSLFLSLSLWIKTQLPILSPFAIYLTISSPSFARPLDFDQAIPWSVANRISWPETVSAIQPIPICSSTKPSHACPILPLRDPRFPPTCSAACLCFAPLCFLHQIASKRSYRGSYCVQ